MNPDLKGSSLILASSKSGFMGDILFICFFQTEKCEYLLNVSFYSCHLLWEIPISVNEVQSDHDEYEEADDTDTDGGHGHQAGAGGQPVSQLVR